MNAHLKFTIDDCTILDEFYEPVGKNRRKFYYIMTPYGTCKVRADSFKKGFVPRITTALDKNEYFRKMCYKSFGDDNDDLSEINFITAKINIKVIDREFGPYWVQPYNYLNGYRNKKRFTFSQKCNQDEVFKKVNRLHKDLKILEGEVYTGMKNNILLQNKYGVVSCQIGNLLEGKIPSIQSAIDKNSYFANQAKEIHGDSYDYSLVEYTNNTTKVKIIGPNGEFMTRPNHHLSGVGCPIEGDKRSIEASRINPMGWNCKSWNKVAKISKNFTGFKVYIIECWNENERFYKIGRNFLKVRKRFSTKVSMPYAYNIVNIFTFKTAKEAFYAEALYKSHNKEYKYKPHLQFGGRYECFNRMPKI